jgi:hypothetical protein
MKIRIQKLLATLAMLALATLSSELSTARAQGTAFTYQGQLLLSNSPANGSYNMIFSLFENSGGSGPLLFAQTNLDVNVSGGLFTTELDFGPGVFSGATYWLQTQVESNGASTYTALSPLIQVTPSPYAVYAESASNFSGTLPSGGLSGTYSNPVAFVDPSNSFVGNGSGLTGLNAANITSGTLALAQLPASVLLNNASNASLGSLTLKGALNLPFPAIMSSGGSNFMFEEGSLYMGFQNSTYAQQANLFNTGFGDYALAYEATRASASNGNYNTAIGEYALFNNQSGSENTASGFDALYNNESGWQNTASGWKALAQNTNGSLNAAFGFQALVDNVASYNTASGAFALFQNTTGSNNTASGYAALGGNGLMTGSFNTANGSSALNNSTSGSYNTAVGGNALLFNSAGSDNIGVGYGAGFNLTTGSYNIDIGNSGVAGESDVIRIGTTNVQTAAYMAGIYQTSLPSNSPIVVVDSSGQLGSISGIPTSDLTGQISDSQLVNDAVTVLAGTGLAGGGSVALGNSITLYNAGVTSLANGGGVTVNSSSGAVTLGSTPITFNYGAGLSGSGSVSLGGTMTLDNTGVTSLASGGGITVSASTGGVTLGSTATSSDIANDIVSRDSTGSFAAQNITANGIFTGNGSGLTSLSAAQVTSQASYNLLIGTSVSMSTANCIDNTVYGDQAFVENSSGSENTAVGEGALYNNSTGSYNVALGYQAGINNLNTASYNIDIGNPGNSSDADTIRIGAQGTQTSAYVAGISGTSLVADSLLVGVTSSGQLGTVGSYFTGINRAAPITGAEYFGMTAPVSSGFGGMYINTTGASAQPFYGYALGGSAKAWTYVDGTDTNKWKLNYGLTVDSSGRVGINNTDPANLLVVGTGGAYCNGTTWVNGSDRNTKEDLEAINPRDVLDKVSAMPITEWRYKVEDKGVKHIGPMSQDFHAAFSLNGADDKHIATIDEGGVALAAIQGLNEKLEAQLKAKDAAIQSLEQRLERLEKLVSATPSQP